MSIRFDEKGKYFTSVISKEPRRVYIQTLLHHIEGNVYTKQDERFKDAMNHEEVFIAVTDATVQSIQGKVLFQSEFLLVNRNQIVWMVPIEEIESDSTSG
jgi:membrane-associated PAP2 superfamily phosphatase